jgi:hypothetical protein
MEKPCNCGLCNPQPGRRYHPKYGYDLDAVSQKECLMCGEPIGSEPYKEVLTWARFGQMLFVHKRCDGAAKGEHQ